MLHYLDIGMYDSLTMFVVSSQPARALGVLTSVKEITYRSTGEIAYKGNLRNLRVTIKSNGVVIIGSLAKFYFGNNLKVLTREDTRYAIEQLSDTFGFDV